MPEPLPVRPVLARPATPPYQSHQLHHGVFTARQCRRIAELADELHSAPADLEGTDQQLHDESIRDSSTAWLEPSPATGWIFDKLATVATRANRAYGFELNGFDEDLQLTTYDRAGAFYTWHQDGLDRGVSGRKLSLVVQLTDPADYTGGELELFDVTEDYDEHALADYHESSRRQGTVVAFPSFEFHRVQPLRSGRRQSLVAWVSGPPFR